MRGPDLGERFASAVVGAFFGGAVGLILGWLAGVHHSAAGAGVPMELGRWVFVAAGLYGALGFIMGSDIGSHIGSLLGFMCETDEDGDSNALAAWIWLALCVGLAFIIWRWLSRSASGHHAAVYFLT